MTTPDLHTEVAALRALVDAQQEQISTLTARVERQVAAAPPGSGAMPETTRRHLLTRALAAGAVGAAGATVVARPAAAADGDAVLAGETNTATSTTVLNRTGAGNADGLQVSTEGTGDAIAGFSPGGQAIIGLSNTGDGVFGQCSAGGRGVVANATGSGLGLSAFSNTGTGALVGSTSGLPLVVSAAPGSAFGPPTTTSSPAGAFYVDSFGDLYYNAFEGATDGWVQLNGPNGTSFFFSPQRGYDSRPGEPGSGPKTKLAAGETRTIDLRADADILTSDKAVVLNVTVTNTEIGGFASIYPAGTPTLNPPSFASINWSGTGQTIGNHVPTAITEGKIKIFAINPTDIILDVIGYVV